MMYFFKTCKKCGHKYECVDPAEHILDGTEPDPCLNCGSTDFEFGHNDTDMAFTPKCPNCKNENTGYFTTGSLLGVNQDDIKKGTARYIDQWSLEGAPRYFCIDCNHIWGKFGAE